MNHLSEPNHIRHEIRASGVEACDRDNHATAIEALAAIRQLRLLPNRRWITARCCRCGLWHIGSLPRDSENG